MTAEFGATETKFCHQISGHGNGRESKDQLYRYLNVYPILNLTIQCQSGATNFPPDNQEKMTARTGQPVPWEPSKIDY